MPDIKLIATDLDGTFLNSDRGISPKNKESVARLLNAGIEFCLASGRGITTMLPYATEMGIVGPMVTSNGSYVVDRDGIGIYQAFLDPKAVDIVLDYAAEHGLHTNAYLPEDIFFSQDGEWADLYRQRTGCDPTIMSLDEMRGIKTTKLLFVADQQDVEAAEEPMRKLMEPFGVPVVLSERNYIEFLPADTNKSIGLSKLSESLGIDSADVVAIGDWLNDREMLAWAGWSFAVENAHPEIKALVDHVVGSNDEDGFAQMVDMVLTLRERVY